MLLKNARTTEPMLFNGLKLISAKFQGESKKCKEVVDLQNKLSEAAESYVADIEKEEEVRPAIGAKLIKKNYNIVTHCHS